MTKKTLTFKTTKNKHSRRQKNTDIQDDKKQTFKTKKTQTFKTTRKPRILYQPHLFPVKLPNLTAKHAIYIALFHIIVTKLLQLCFVRR